MKWSHIVPNYSCASTCQMHVHVLNFSCLKRWKYLFITARASYLTVSEIHCTSRSTFVYYNIFRYTFLLICLQSMLSFRQQIFDAVRTFEWVTTHMKILNIPSTAYNALFSNVRSNFFCFWKLGALPSPKIVISFAYFIWIINQYSRREILNSEMLPFVDLTCNKIATNAGKNLIHVSISTQLLYPLLAFSLTYSIRNNALLADLYNY